MTAVERQSPVSPASGLLSIGELGQRTGVATSALRYYDELGLVRPAAREAGGQRRYAPSAVQQVALIRFLGAVGFSLREITFFLAGEQPSRRQLINRKLTELADQRRQLEVALELLEHGRTCPAGDPLTCSRFWSIIEGHRNGLSLAESHARVHRTSEEMSGSRGSAA